MLSLWLLAQTTTAPDPGVWSQFGPFAICAVLAAGIIGWLLKDRVRSRADCAEALSAAKADYTADINAHREQLDLERKANRELYDRIIAQQERLVPIVERAAHALEHAVEAR